MTDKNNKPDDCKWFKWGEQMRLGYYYTSAFYNFKGGDKEGCDKCQLALGIFYQNGVTVEQDYKKGQQLFKKAYEQGYKFAKYRIDDKSNKDK